MSEQVSKSHRTEAAVALAVVRAPATPPPILFYGATNGPYSCFSNFAAYPITMPAPAVDSASTVDLTRWPTTEHYFQAMKFAPHTVHVAAVHSANGPKEAAARGRDRRRPFRRDWDEVKDEIMYQCVKAKFTQHTTIQATLLATGSATIVEHTARDKYWGDGGGPGLGKNMLGVTLMRVRKELRDGLLGRTAATAVIVDD